MTDVGAEDTGTGMLDVVDVVWGSLEPLEPLPLAVAMIGVIVVVVLVIDGIILLDAVEGTAVGAGTTIDDIVTNGGGTMFIGCCGCCSWI